LSEIHPIHHNDLPLFLALYDIPLVRDQGDNNWLETKIYMLEQCMTSRGTIRYKLLNNEMVYGIIPIMYLVH
jgi:hypothetical protein